jgi:hypothetical protein
MELTRKRKRELKKLQGRAQNVWSEQMLVLDHARSLARDASNSANDYAHNEGATAARGAYDTRVRPALDSGRAVVGGARERVVTDIAPAISAAVASALASVTTVKEGGDKAVDTAVKTVGKNADVSDKVAQKATMVGKKEVAKAAAKATGQVSKKDATKAAAKALKKKEAAKAAVKAGSKLAKNKKKSAGPGGFILGGFIVVAVAGIAYAIWQTLRADDELWIADEELEPETTAASTTGTIDSTTDSTTTVTPVTGTGTTGTGTTPGTSPLS